MAKRSRKEKLACGDLVDILPEAFPHGFRGNIVELSEGQRYVTVKCLVIVDPSELRKVRVGK